MPVGRAEIALAALAQLTARCASAASCSLSVAADVQEGRIIPTGDLAVTIRLAILDEFATGQKLRHATGEANGAFFGITPQVAGMLDWLIRHDPRSGRHVIGEIIGEAERNLDVPHGVSEHSLETALHLDGQLNEGSLNDYLDRVLSPRTGGSVAPVIPPVTTPRWGRPGLFHQGRVTGRMNRAIKHPSPSCCRNSALVSSRGCRAVRPHRG